MIEGMQLKLAEDLKANDRLRWSNLRGVLEFAEVLNVMHGSVLMSGHPAVMVNLATQHDGYVTATFPNELWVAVVKER